MNKSKLTKLEKEVITSLNQAVKKIEKEEVKQDDFFWSKFYNYGGWTWFPHGDKPKRKNPRK